MGKEYTCSYCDQQFKDGDIIERAGEDNYHSFHNRKSFVNQPGIATDCFEDFVQLGHAVASQGPLFFYDGNLYTGAQMNELAETEVDLQVERNSGNNGHTVHGDLSGLAGLTNNSQ